MCIGSGILNVANFVFIPKQFNVTNMKYKRHVGNAMYVLHKSKLRNRLFDLN